MTGKTLPINFLGIDGQAMGQPMVDGKDMTGQQPQQQQQQTAAGMRTVSLERMDRLNFEMNPPTDRFNFVLISVCLYLFCVGSFY